MADTFEHLKIELMHTTGATGLNFSVESQQVKGGILDDDYGSCKDKISMISLIVTKNYSDFCTLKIKRCGATSLKNKKPWHVYRIKHNLCSIFITLL